SQLVTRLVPSLSRAAIARLCCTPLTFQIFPFFFLTIPRPPRSPLFPYTTLFRSEREWPLDAWRTRYLDEPLVKGMARRLIWSFRSEEHTSELQSLTNLVCRLLLEKKKNNKSRHYDFDKHHPTAHRNMQQSNQQVY